ncbi:MAG: dienelactone hydrolase family protein [Sphingomonadales bacterium]|nr:dienelactone hydrolase family protein [Sphingomonadales bacterium]MBD3773528.1 dienelactone hydrolase family protein [Paracoccaceae bacterium]
MCDEQDMARFAQSARGAGVNRRQFAVLGAAGAIAACTTPQKGEASENMLEEGEVSFATPDGTMDGYFVRPAAGKHPAVLFWPDIAGVREAKRSMARRLASEGYAVFLANPYYRDVKGEQFKDFADFMANSGFQKVGPWREKLVPEAILRDAGAATGWLAQQDSVDETRGMGSQGYCMTGSFAMFTAVADVPHVRAVGSFHGGGLVRQGAMSPHTTFGEAKAQYLICIAKNDDAKAPGDKDVLREAADAVGVKAEIEVYNADHGWCVLDSPSYDKPEAERAWARLLDLYGRTLKG